MGNGQTRGSSARLPGRSHFVGRGSASQQCKTELALIGIGSMYPKQLIATQQKQHLMWAVQEDVCVTIMYVTCGICYVCCKSNEWEKDGWVMGEWVGG